MISNCSGYQVVNIDLGGHILILHRIQYAIDVLAVDHNIASGL